MKSKPRKAQIHPTLPLETFTRFKRLCTLKGLTEGAVVDAALLAFLDDTRDKTLILQQLQKLNRAVLRLERSMEAMGEALGIYVRYWFSHTPQIPEGQKEDAALLGKRRYHKYCESVATSIGLGHRFIDDFFQETLADEAECAAAAMAAEEALEAERPIDAAPPLGDNRKEIEAHE
jgi:hypothetical protein